MVNSFYSEEKVRALDLNDGLAYIRGGCFMHLSQIGVNLITETLHRKLTAVATGLAGKLLSDM